MAESLRNMVRKNSPLLYSQNSQLIRSERRLDVLQTPLDEDRMAGPTHRNADKADIAPRFTAGLDGQRR